MNEAFEQKKQKQKAALASSRKPEPKQHTPLSTYYLSDGTPTILSSSVTERTPLTQHTDSSPVVIECGHDIPSYRFEPSQPSHVKQTPQMLVSRDSQNSEVKSCILIIGRSYL